MMRAMAETKVPREEPPHDVLAAEAFAMPAPDPELHHHGRIVLPDDPAGVSEPHDVLAAEEFPMPAPRPGVSEAPVRRGSSRRLALAGAALATLAFAALRRARRA
jgi:hypothetical protein